MCVWRRLQVVRSITLPPEALAGSSRTGAVPGFTPGLLCSSGWSRQTLTSVSEGVGGQGGTWSLESNVCELLLLSTRVELLTCLWPLKESRLRELRAPFSV